MAKVITLISPKGGVGKTTIALVLAQEFAHRGHRVVLIDADPTGNIVSWARSLEAPPRGIQVDHPSPEAGFYDVIDRVPEDTDFVVVDTGGITNETVGEAVGESDLVLIPVGGNQMEANLVLHAEDLVRKITRKTRREIPYAVVKSQTSSFMDRNQLAILRAIDESPLSVLDVGLSRRSSFNALTQLGKTVHEMTTDDVANPRPAIENSRALGDAVIAQLETIDA